MEATWLWITFYLYFHKTFIYNQFHIQMPLNGDSNLMYSVNGTSFGFFDYLIKNKCQ